MSLIPQVRSSEHSSLRVRADLGTRARQTAYLRDDETFATPLVLILLDKFGLDALEWTPETIRREIEDEFTVRLSRLNLDKIMAGILLLTTNYFFRDVVKFIWICNVLSGNEFDPDEFDPADPAEMLLAVNEAFLLWPPRAEDRSESEFSEEIQEYIRQMLNEDGIIRPFDVLRLATDSDRTRQVEDEFVDDPDMYAAIYQSQQGKVSELANEHTATMMELLDQLTELPLQNGSTGELVARLRKAIPRIGAEASIGSR